MKVIFDTNADTWVAVCSGCVMQWLSTDEEVPDSVKTAVVAAVAMTTPAMEEADAAGVTMLQVGAPYPIPTSLDGGVLWILTPDVVQCAVHYRNVTPDIEQQFRVERTEFALTSGDHALILSLRLGRIFGWQDGSWQAVMQPREVPAGIPEPEANKHLLVQLVLVDSATHVVAAMRVVTWPPTFHAAVHKAVQAQLTQRSLLEDGMREIAYWMSRYPTADALAKRRAEAKCSGGVTIDTTRMRRS